MPSTLPVHSIAEVRNDACAELAKAALGCPRQSSVVPSRNVRRCSPHAARDESGREFGGNGQDFEQDPERPVNDVPDNKHEPAPGSARRRAPTRAEMPSYIAQLVSSAPPLTTEQRYQLRLLLRRASPGVGLQAG